MERRGRWAALVIVGASVLCGAAQARGTLEASEAGADAANDQAAPASVPAEASARDPLAEAQRLMFSNPSEALHAAEQATLRPLDAEALTTAYWLQAEALVRLNRASEAGAFAERAAALIDPAADTKLRADLSLTRGRIARRAGRVEEALSFFHDAHGLFVEADEARGQAIALQSIGSIYNDAGAYERVLDYYARAEEAFADDARLALVSLNNRGNALKMLGRYDEALGMFAQALAIAEARDSDFLRVRILTNIAAVHVAAGALDGADTVIADALALARRSNQRSWQDFVLGVRAQARAARSDEAGALADIRAVFDGQDLGATPAPYREFHQLAAALYEEGDPARALAHMKALARLEGAAREVAASANLALRAAEFDFASQELKFERLASEALRAQLAHAEAERGRRHVQMTALLSGLFVLIGASLLAVRFFRRNNEALRDMHAELAASHDELTDTNAKLVAANEARMRFLAATSHEIRTPLNGIIGMTEVVLRDMAADEENHARVRIANQAGRDLLTIVNDLLDMAKIERDETEIVRTETRLPSLFEDTAMLWQKAAEDKGIRLRASFYACPASAEIDEKHVRQIVNNLINNAIKFTHKGEVCLTVGQERSRLVVRVRDTGIGIAPEDQARVFEMFEQASTGGSRRYGGTGLGLAICRRLARLMGGDIEVVSCVGEGSTFTLTVPLTDAGASILQDQGFAADHRPAPQPRLQTGPQTEPQTAPQAMPQAASRDARPPEPDPVDDEATDVGPHADAPPLCPPPAFDLSELSVLVAEDNAVNQMVVRAYLANKVRELVIVADGNEALSAAEERPFDVVLMDKQMPNRDGAEATAAIRALGGAWADIPIIAVTADAFQGAKDEMLEAGCQAFVAKPLSEDHLLATIERVMTGGAEETAAAA